MVVWSFPFVQVQNYHWAAHLTQAFLAFVYQRYLPLRQSSNRLFIDVLIRDGFFEFRCIWQAWQGLTKKFCGKDPVRALGYFIWVSSSWSFLFLTAFILA